MSDYGIEGYSGRCMVTPSERECVLHHLPPDGRVLETGTCDGQTARFLAERGASFVQSVDPFKQGPDIRGINQCAGKADMWLENAEANEKGNQALFTGVIQDFAAEYRGEHFDLMFIDGDHSYAGCMIDLMYGLTVLKAGAVICVHDYGRVNKETLFPNPAGEGVLRAVHDFCIYGPWEIVERCDSVAVLKRRY